MEITSKKLTKVICYKSLFVTFYLCFLLLSLIFLLPHELMTSSSIDSTSYLSIDFRSQFFTFNSNIEHAKIYSSFDLRSVQLTLNKMKNFFGCFNSNHEFCSKECQLSAMLFLMESTTDQFKRISRVTLFYLCTCATKQTKKKKEKIIINSKGIT